MTICSPWATEDDLCSPCLSASLGYGELDPYLQQASEILYMLSGQVFSGSCQETVRPCTKQIWGGYPYTGYDGWLRNQDTWRAFLSPWSPFPWSAGCGCHSFDDCSCHGHSVIELPRDFITSVDEVKLDGNTFTDYELQANYLARTDGKSWPCCTDTLTITYTHGRQPPQAGIKAAAVLACELLMACEPDAIEGGQCRLPANVSSISRQGVSVIFNSLTRSGGPFRFGIWEIDLFLEAFTSAPSCAVMSPDTPTVRKILPTGP